MSTILLIDGNPLMWRAVYARGVAYVQEGILCYFFDILRSFPEADVLLFWDEGKSRWRSDYYTEYKMNREAKKQEIDLVEMGVQKNLARSFLKDYGIRDISVPGVEADDTIAFFAEYFSDVYLIYDNIIIASRDHDLWQLINAKVKVYDPYSLNIIDESYIETEYGIKPQRIADLKSMEGDVSDNIKGIKKVGAVTALKLLTTYGGLEDLLDSKNHKELLKKKTTARVVNNASDMEESYQLVKTPSLVDSTFYLTDQERSMLIKEINKPVQLDRLHIQAAIESLGLYSKCSASNFRQPLTEEIKGIIPWLLDRSIGSIESLESYDNTVLSCNRCSLNYKFKEHPQLPMGSKTASIMIVQRDPSSDRMFTKKILDDLDIDKSEIWLTYALKCACIMPPEYGTIQACSGFLREEIKLIKPKFIITLGLEAMTLCTNYRSDLAKHCGEIVKSEIPVGILFDSRELKRSPAKAAEIEFGLGRIKKYLIDEGISSNRTCEH